MATFVTSATAIVATATRLVTARIADRNFLLHSSLDHSAVLHSHFVRDFFADPTFGFIRNLLGHADGVAFSLAFRNAFVSADLFFFVTDFLFASSDSLANRFHHAHLFHFGARDGYADFLRTPDFFGLIFGTRITFAAILFLEHAAKSFKETWFHFDTFVYPMALIFPLLLVSGDRLADPILFHDRDGLGARNAYTVSFFDRTPHRDLFISGHFASSFFRNLNTLVCSVCFTDLFGLIAGFVCGIILRDTLCDADFFILDTGVATIVTTMRLSFLSASGRQCCEGQDARGQDCACIT